MKHNIVPLLEVGEHTDSISVQALDMPGVPVDRLTVDVTRLERSMHWGCIKYLSIGSYEGEGTSYTAGGIQQNWDGTLSMTGEKVDELAPVSDPNSETLDKNSDYGWRNTAVYFNTTALSEMRDGKESQVRAIDRSFRKTMRQEIRSHEMSPENIKSEISGAISVTIALGVPALILGGQPVEGVAEGAALLVPILMLPKPWLPLVQAGFHHIADHKYHEFSPKYSSMFSFRFDRVALAARHLARPIIKLAQQ